MDERSSAKGADIIHSSFVVIGATHAHVSVHKHSTAALVFSEMNSFVNTFLYKARWILPLALYWQQNTLQRLKVSNKKEAGSI